MILAIAHQAGGVGKTTTALNLGYELARMGARVLLVDVDPQADLSSRLQLANVGHVLADGLLDGAPVAVNSVSFSDVTLDVLPAHTDMSETEIALAGKKFREARLSKVLRPIASDYDFVLIDCPPSLGVLTTNALYAADGVLVPVQAQDKAYSALDLTIRTIRDVIAERRDHDAGDDFNLFGILVTMVDNTGMAREIVNSLRAEFAQTFATTIPMRVKIREDVRRHAPISTFAPNDATAIAYQQLAQEVMNRVKQTTAVG